MVLLAVAVLQAFAVPQHKVTVIDFTLAGHTSSAAVEQAAPYQAPAASREPKHARAIRPQKIAEKRSAPHPEVEKARSAADDAPREAEPSTLLPRAIDGPEDVPSAQGAFRDAADAAGAAQGAAGSAGHAGPDAPPAQGAAGSAGPAGAGGTPEKFRAAYLKEHFVYIRDRITKSISYPHMARQMDWCGQVKIAFVVCEDGGVNDVKVVESSGFNILDRNAVDTVKKIAPFPRPPVRAEIRMAITYRLN